VGDKNGCKTESEILTIENLSIEKISVRKGYSIFPNPSSGEVFVQSKDIVQLSIKDMLGREILANKITKKVDLTTFAEGHYILTIRDVDGQLIGIEKVVKKNSAQ
jgi:hypothetical protein